MRHPLIRQHQRHRIVASLQLAQRGQPRIARIRPHHAIILCIVPAQIALNRAQHFRVVIDSQQNRLRHSPWDECTRRVGYFFFAALLFRFILTLQFVREYVQCASSSNRDVEFVGPRRTGCGSSGHLSYWPRIGRRRLARMARRSRVCRATRRLREQRCPQTTVGLAVNPLTFEVIRDAQRLPTSRRRAARSGRPRVRITFRLKTFALDILTTRDPNGQGAIARYLSKFGEGIQQVEYRCRNVDAATRILKKKFGVDANLSADTSRCRRHPDQFFPGAHRQPTKKS